MMTETISTNLLLRKAQDLGRLVAALENVRVSGRKQEEPLMVRLLQEIMDETSAEGLDSEVKRKMLQTSLETVCRIYELAAKSTTDLHELETKRSDLKYKRAMLRKRDGPGKARTASVEPPGLSEVAALMRPAK
jgi:hypothetical protein